MSNTGTTADTTAANLAFLTLLIAAGDRPVCIGYFEHGPTAGQVFVSSEVTFGATMRRRHLDDAPMTLISTVGIQERTARGCTPAEILAEAAGKLPGWARR